MLENILNKNKDNYIFVKVREYIFIKLIVKRDIINY